MIISIATVRRKPRISRGLYIFEEILTPSAHHTLGRLKCVGRPYAANVPWSEIEKSD